MKVMLWHIIKEIKNLEVNIMTKKKEHIPPRTNNEQKETHIKVLIGAIIVTFIVVVFTITYQ